MLIPNIFIEYDNQETIERYILIVMYSFTVIIYDTHNYKYYFTIEKDDTVKKLLCLRKIISFKKGGN